MRSKDIVGDLSLLDREHSDNYNIRLPWKSHKDEIREIPDPSIPLDSQSKVDDFEPSKFPPPDQDGILASMSNSLYVGSSIFRPSPEPEMSEYGRMKIKFFEGISKGQRKVEEAIEASKHTRSTTRLQQLALFDNIGKLKGQYQPSYDVPIDDHRISMRFMRQPSEPVMPVKVIKRRIVPAKQPPPSYIFDTKKMTEAAKQIEFESQRQLKRKHDFLKEARKKAKFDAKEQELTDLARLESRKDGRLDNQGQRMIIAKMAASDIKTNLAVEKAKCGVKTGGPSKEDAYMEAIRLKMQIISRVLKK